MEHIFIDKAENGFDYAFVSFDGVNFAGGSNEEFYPEDSNFQVISNGKYFIFYSQLYRIEMQFLKVYFENTLKDIEDLTIDVIRKKIVHDLKNELYQCYRLIKADPDKNIKDRMTSPIYILTKDKIYTIGSTFTVYEVPNVYNEGDIRVLVEKQVLGNLKPHDLLNYYVQQVKDYNYFNSFPYVFGNTYKDEIIVKDIGGNETVYKMEDFVCRW